ncbi:hypothetical protein HK405_011189, partial [Cladochytrium tenue]
MQSQVMHRASPSIPAPWSWDVGAQVAGTDAIPSPLVGLDARAATVAGAPKHYPFGNLDLDGAATGWGFATLPAQMPTACCSHRHLSPCSDSAATVRPHAAAAAAEHQAVARTCRRHSNIGGPLTPPLTPIPAAAPCMHRLAGCVQMHAPKDRSLRATVPVLTSPPPPRPLLPLHVVPQQQAAASTVAPSAAALSVPAARLDGIAAAYSPGPSMNTLHATQHVHRTAPTSAAAAAVTTVPRHVVLRKTELCASWLRSGTCVFGQRCDFAHSTDELRPVTRPPNWR